MHVDHLVYSAADLSAGMDRIESLLGVRPVVGGQHPQWGTHNALLSLGSGTYLEVIAPDPSLAVPQRGVLLQTTAQRQPWLATWALGVSGIDRLAIRAIRADTGIGPVEQGQRQTPSGGWLKWKLTDLYALPMGGAIPFLIEWGQTPHPCASLPAGGQLTSLRIDHPDHKTVAAKLDLLASNRSVIHVGHAPDFRIVATIETAQGRVELS